MPPNEEIERLIRQREPVFHCEPADAREEHFERMIDSEFFEIGASGRFYSRDRVIEIVVDRYERDDPGVDNEVEDFEVRTVADGIYLATYLLHQPDGHAKRTTRRATLWADRGDDLVVVYHQGTIVGA